MQNKFVVSYVLAHTILYLMNISSANARDQEWCLSCHQYPGLVRVNTAGKLTALHIDEQKYLASSHGKFHCTACHREVDKIPHVGKNGTSCQTACHQSRQDKTLLARTSLKGFHRQQQSFIRRLNDGGACNVCHAIYPHKKEPFVRSFLNMHTGYLVCEVCHINANQNTHLEYRWLDARQVSFSGSPFGSVYDPTHSLNNKPDNVLSRLAPFITERQRAAISLFNIRDTADAIQFQQQRQQLSTAVKKEKLRHFHRDVVSLNKAKACDACHTTNGLLNFDRLGFSQGRSETLQTMPIGNIIKKYDVFYVPKLGAM